MSDPVIRLNVALKGRYRIDRELGEGGMATVYLADDLKHERKVALKVLKPELAVIVATLVLTGCSGSDCVSGPLCGDPPVPPPTTLATISLSASSLSFQGLQDRASPASQTVSLTNTGGGTLTWTATANAPWVTLTPASGAAPSSVDVGVNTAGLSADTYTASITFAAPGATNTPASLAVNLTVGVGPGVGLSATTFAFTGQAGGASPANQTLTLRNTGGGVLNWSATDDSPWLTLSATSGTAPSTVALSASTVGLSAGTYNGTITVTATDASNSPAPIGVTLTVTQTFDGSWAGTTAQDSTVTFQIQNSGITTLHFSFGASGSGCSLTSAVTTSFTPPISVSGGSFSISRSSSTGSYTMTGNLTSGTSASGTLMATAQSFPIPGVPTCTATVTTSWTATKGGAAPGGATKLAFTVQPSAVVAGAAIAPAVQVTVQDAQGKTVTSSTASITMSITSGTGTSGAVLGGTLTRAAVNGVATFSDLTLDKAGTAYTLTAAATGLTSTASTAFSVNPGTPPGAAARLAFAVQPSSVVAGAAITPAVQVAVQDAQGRTVTSSTASITMSITSGTGTSGAVLGGTLTRAAVNGVATFSDLTLDKDGTAYTLTATATGLTSTASTAFSVNPPATGDYTGHFLSWTGSEDPLHSFTLVRVNGQTGGVTNIGGSDFFTALVYGPSGTLYGVSDELHVINPTNGSSALIQTFVYEGARTLMTAATFSPGGTLYVMENASPQRVFTVNLSNAELTYVGTPSALIRALGFGSSGTLYGAFADLFTLSPTNLSTLSTVGRTPTFISQLALGEGGTMYGMDFAPSTQLYSLNLSNGSATSSLALGSQALGALVAERSSAAASVAALNRVAGPRGLASAPSIAALLERERSVKDRHTAIVAGLVKVR